MRSIRQKIGSAADAAADLRRGIETDALRGVPFGRTVLVISELDFAGRLSRKGGLWVSA